MGGQELDGHATAQLGVVGEIDLAHATGAELLRDPVMRDGAPNHTEATFPRGGEWSDSQWPATFYTNVWGISKGRSR